MSLTTQAALQLLSIPVVSAIVGWGTNVVALKMTFYPLEFKGIPPYLGWQGIIPAKAESMASRTVDLMTTKLVGVQEVIERLDPDRVVAEMQDGVAVMLRQVIDDVMMQEQPELWRALPEAIRQGIYDRASADAPAVIRESLHDIKIDIEDLIDLKKMAVDALLADRAFLNQIFLECGKDEFIFIERSGIYFGFIFGLIQMLLWIVYPASWTLPLAGFFLGYITNVLALKMIFEPANPVKVGRFVWQGSFLKRQVEVSEAYARLIARNIITTHNIVKTISNGPGTTKLLEIVERHIREAVGAYQGVPQPIARFMLGSARYDAVRERIARAIVRAVPEGPIYLVESYAHQALDLENTLRTRLEALPPDQFAGLLRPIFQEDEWKLLLVGAVLGLLVGLFQVFVVLV
jgi:uncharacterized membrane protein YheB (UPF0754 family)